MVTIVFEAVVVTRQSTQTVLLFFGIETSKIFLCHQKVTSLVILIFCNKLDNKKAQMVSSFAFFGTVRFFLNVSSCGTDFHLTKGTFFTLVIVCGLKKAFGLLKAHFSALRDFARNDFFAFFDVSSWGKAFFESYAFPSGLFRHCICIYYFFTIFFKR